MKTSAITLIISLLGNCVVADWMFEEKYRGDYRPEVIQGELGPQIVAPDTPYVAAAGRNRLYFIDTRHTREDAAHIKEQIEQASVPRHNNRVEVNERTGLVQNIDAATGKVLFTFDPTYARVLFAHLLNAFNAEFEIPVHSPAGDQLVTYDVETGQVVRTGEAPALAARKPCGSYTCWSDDSCRIETNWVCDKCQRIAGNLRCSTSIQNFIGGCPGKVCSRAVDESRQIGETYATFHKRMDEKHWHR
jgi:hypothetical protein